MNDYFEFLKDVFLSKPAPQISRYPCVGSGFPCHEAKGERYEIRLADTVIADQHKALVGGRDVFHEAAHLKPFGTSPKTFLT